MLGILTGSLPLPTAPAVDGAKGALHQPTLLQGSDDIWVLNRHGTGHHFLPHNLPYRENVLALRDKGCTHVLALYTVGGVRADLKPGSIALVEDFIDYTWGRPDAIPGEGDVHQECHQLVDRKLRGQVQELLVAKGVPVLQGGVLAVTQGPRYETPAEVRRYRRDGADLIGMTAMPEMVLANQVGMKCVALALVVNWAAGLSDGSDFEQARIKAYYEGFAAVVQDLARSLAACQRAGPA